MIDTKKLRERVSMNIDGRLWDLADEIDRALEELDELRAKVAGTDIIASDDDICPHGTNMNAARCTTCEDDLHAKLDREREYSATLLRQQKERDRRIAELEAALQKAREWMGCLADPDEATYREYITDKRLVDAALSAPASPATSDTVAKTPSHDETIGHASQATATKADDHSETCKTLNWCGNHLTPVEWANVDRMIQAARDAVEHGVVPDPWESRIWKALNAIDGDDSLDTHDGAKK